MSYVLITGSPENENTAKMEVIGPDGRTKICKGNNAAYPLEINDATATYTNDKIVVCGGSAPYKFGMTLISNDKKISQL